MNWSTWFRNCSKKSTLLTISWGVLIIYPKLYCIWNCCLGDQKIIIGTQTQHGPNKAYSQEFEEKIYVCMLFSSCIFLNMRRTILSWKTFSILRLSTTLFQFFICHMLNAANLQITSMCIMKTNKQIITVHYRFIYTHPL